MQIIEWLVCLAECKLVMLPTLFAERHNLSAMFVSVSSVVLNVGRWSVEVVVAPRFLV